MKAISNEYYTLNTGNTYFSVDLQRNVQFFGTLAVKCGSSFGDCGHFGYLIDTSNSNGPDYETNHAGKYNLNAA